MNKLLRMMIVLAFVLFAGLWIAQSYRPIVLSNSFNGATHVLGHDGGNLNLRLVGAGGISVRDGDYYLKVDNTRAPLLPEPGSRHLWEVTDGRLYRVCGEISPEPPPSNRHASIRITIDQDQSWPLWPVLLVLGIGAALVCFRFALRRRHWMVETYRAPHLNRKTSILCGVLLMLFVGLYLAQRVTVITLYQTLSAPAGKLTLDDHLQWALSRTDEIDGFAGKGSVQAAPAGRKLQIQLELDSAFQIPAREYWLVCIGHDGIRLMSATVDPAVPRGGYVFTYVADPQTVVQLPLLLAIVVLGVWFASRTVVPSYTYIHRNRNGLCLRCGYDLRASSGLCPECGARPSGSGV